jgi:3-phosphoshikimate 1-carboxyvinyltransferase
LRGVGKRYKGILNKTGVAGMRRIAPKAYFTGEYQFPGDKSITHRAIILNSCADGFSIVKNASLGKDCLSTCYVMQELGAKIERDGTTLKIIGTSAFLDGKRLDCGNSATTLRLLTGLLAGKGINAELYGDSSLSLRPMERVSNPLRFLGANVKTTNGQAPVFVAPALLKGDKIALDIPSAQVKSALLLAGLNAEGKTAVIEPRKSRDHTERMLKAMGAKISVDGNAVMVEKSRLNAIGVDVPADISSAAYFMALGALKGQVLCKNVGVNPTRTGILTAFDRLGVTYTLFNKKEMCGEEVADIFVEKSKLRAITLGADDVPSMIDELPLIALLCAFADGESRITGAGELKVKESDRILATAQLINGLGGDCTPTDDGFIIRGKKSLKGGDIDSRFDHRIAMTGAVGLIASENGGSISHPECCEISFPDFYEKLGV